MKVKTLIKKLEEMDQDADVMHLWDGELRTGIERVYMGKTGICVTADYEMVAYCDDARPIDAPTPEEDSYWKTRPSDRYLAEMESGE